GSPYIQAAQVVVQLAGVRVDMVFGPSETVVLADESADPLRVAADLLTEAEHGDDSAALLVTDSSPLIEDVARDLEALRARSPSPSTRASPATPSPSAFAASIPHEGHAPMTAPILIPPNHDDVLVCDRSRPVCCHATVPRLFALWAARGEEPPHPSRGGGAVA